MAKTPTDEQLVAAIRRALDQLAKAVEHANDAGLIVEASFDAKDTWHSSAKGKWIPRAGSVSATRSYSAA